MSPIIHPLSVLVLTQGRPILLLEGQHPAEFSSILYQHTCLDTFSTPQELAHVCFIRVGAQLQEQDLGTSVLVEN